MADEKNVNKETGEINENKGEEKAVEENKNEVAHKEAAQAPAKQAQGSAYITMILEETKQGFVEANEGLDLDFVRMGDWLTVSKKGNFVEKDDEEVSYGDTIDVVIGYGEKRYSLWGEDDTPEEGQLIVAERTQEAGEAALGEYLAQNPDAAERYTNADIKLRYMAYVVPVETLDPEDFPRIYLMSFSPTDTILFGRWAYNVFTGKFKKTHNVPGKTAVNRLVVRLKTAEKKSKTNAAQSWLGLEFEPVGVFNPADYGINPEEQGQQ